MRAVSPLQLEILLHHYYSPSPWPGDRTTTPYKQAIEFWFDNQMIEEVKSSMAYTFQTTDRGKAYIEAILALPFPKKVWVIDNAV